MDTDLIAFESLIAAQQTMIAAQETAKWTYWMMFATWFAGGATLSAVLVSLYIANKKPVPRINSFVDATIIAPAPGISMVGLSITVANVGLYPVVISSIHWEFGGKKKIVQMFNKLISAQMPKKLEHGESALFFIETENFSEWIVNFRKLIEDSDGKLSKLRFVINLTTGQRISFKPKRDLIETLSEAKTA